MTASQLVLVASLLHVESNSRVLVTEHLPFSPRDTEASVAVTMHADLTRLSETETRALRCIARAGHGGQTEICIPVEEQ